MRTSLAFLLLWPLLAAPPADPAVALSEFVYGGGLHREIHATTIAETDRGLVVAWFGGTHEQHRDVGIWLSRLLDGKWTTAVEVANGEQPDGTRQPTWNPVLFQWPDGPLSLFYKVGPSPREWWGEHKRSDDGGRTWTVAERLPDGCLGPIKNKPLLLPDGSLLCGSSVEIASTPERWSVHFETCRDHGRTWTKGAAVHDGLTVQAIQPSLLRLGGERLLAIGRTRQDRLFEVRSDDGGKTWGPLRLGSLPNNNSGTDAVTLADGRHLLVYNHAVRTQGEWGGLRTPLNVAISDDGTTWSAALVLERDPGEYSYPSVLQTRDGRVHVTYTWNRSKVKHVVLDPQKLSGKPIVAGAWPR